MLFTKKDIHRLLLPLIVEQFLAVLVGMADVLMVSYVGEAAVSAVSIVDAISNLIINLFAALAAGGAVVCAQAIGRRDRETACYSANQLLLASGVMGIAIMLTALIGNRFWLDLLYGSAEADVLANARTYFFYGALSYPFLGLYNASAALFRAAGNSKVSMRVSLYMNAINVAGNALCVYALRMGVEGVAIPTLVSRAFAACMMFFLLRDTKNTVHLIPTEKWYAFDIPLVKKILGIGIPSGLENGMFQLGRVMLQSLVSTLSTATIAAYAVSNNLHTLQYQPGNAVCMAIMTVAGQCVGAQKYEEGVKNTKYLVKIGYLMMLVISSLLVAFRLPLTSLYNLSPDGQAIAAELIVVGSVAITAVWPLAFQLPNALRAASDVKATMMVSIISMWVFRIGLAYLFIRFMNLPIAYIWLAMAVDWIIRAVYFICRFSARRLRPRELYLAEKRGKRRTETPV